MIEKMLRQALLIAAILVFTGVILTANGQLPTHNDLSTDHQTLRDAVEDVEDEVDDMEEEFEDEIEELAEDIEEDFEELNDVVTTEIERLRVEMKAALDNGLQGNKQSIQSIQSEIVRLCKKLESVQREMNATRYTLQQIQHQSPGENQRLLTTSCSELHPTSPSGYYWLQRKAKRVYCDMDRQSCGCGNSNPWGWMRVANIDMTDSNQECPQNFRLRQGTSIRMCEQTRTSGGCTPISFLTYGVRYSKVCGRVKAYQYGSTDAFWAYNSQRTRTIDNNYVDGVSITHGGGPRKHIWTFAAAQDETSTYSEIERVICPCTKTTTSTASVPPFIENDYFCDSGSSTWSHTLHTHDPLWDGQGCGPTSSCCQFNSPPWFCKTLPQPTTDNIQVRVCRSGSSDGEDIPFEVIELYVQ